MKFNELYHLPDTVELDVLSNMSFTIPELRADALENSSYFTLGSERYLKNITPELATEAVGYNAMKYYYGNTPNAVDPATNISVPMLFRNPSYAYEYDSYGVLLGQHPTQGSLYTCSDPTTDYIEFLQGQTPDNYGQLHEGSVSVPLRDAEYKALSAYFEGTNRISNWEDITNTSKAIVTGTTLAISEDQGKKVKLVYFDQPLTYTLNLPLVDGTLYFPIVVTEDRGTGLRSFPVDIPYRSLEVFLNGYRLTNTIDYFIQYPYISICSKMYFDHTQANQSVHIRLHGYATTKEEINSDEIVGFVNNGVLTRNSYYDVRDDRVFSIYVKGKLTPRSAINFAENDNTIRLSDPLNGLPYTMSENMVSVKNICGGDTLALYTANKTLNGKISDLFNHIYQEPPVNEFNVIGDHYYLFSPLVSKMLSDALDGDLIPPSVYMNPYNDSDILRLIETNYKVLYALDPMRKPLPFNIVEVHPTPYQTVTSVSLYLYRYISNVVRIITGGHPERINLSGTLTITTASPAEANAPLTTGGGITVLG
jgi:hypothetical protein